MTEGHDTTIPDDVLADCRRLVEQESPATPVARELLRLADERDGVSTDASRPAATAD